MTTIEFRIEREPDAPGITHPVLAKTWARLEIKVGDHCVTNVLDQRSNTTRSGVYGPAFVVAEWIVQNFWFLLWECTPNETPGLAWLRRHSLAAARQGNSLPNLRLFRDEKAIVAAWGGGQYAEHTLPVNFIGAGRAELEYGDVRTKLSNVVDQAIEMLRGLDHPDANALRADWEAIASITRDDVTLCKRAARIGRDALDPDDVSDELALLLTERMDQLPEPTRDDLLDAAPSKLAATLATVDEVIRADGSARPRLAPGVPQSGIAAPTNGTPAYVQGYRFAETVRVHVGQAPEGPFDLPRALASMQWSDMLETHDPWIVDANVHAAVGMAPRDRPRLLTRSRRKVQDHFVVARGMFALLSGATKTAPRLLTSAGTHLQSASRAFAAELLAPATAIRQRIRNGYDEDRLEDLAEEFQVSPWVIRYQIENHHLQPG